VLRRCSTQGKLSRGTLAARGNPEKKRAAKKLLPCEIRL
jgi:hypothetical protein